MAKQKNYQQQRYCTSDAPKSLADQPFYGLNLDPEQQIFRDAIYDPNTILVACNSVAGCGKSTIAVGVANLLVQYGFYDGICYIASPTMEQKQGYLPGSQEEKSAPYMEPLIEAMNTLGISEYCLQAEDNIQGMKTGDAYIQFMVHTYLRGCNFENKVIIIDEAANFYFDELKKTLTRIHDSCKVILIGHTGQCDLVKHAEKSGFHIYLKAFERYIETHPDDDRIKICSLTTNHRGWISTFCDNVELEY